MKKLSIITICYNEPNLEKTCESIVNQTWQDFEWIVVDGGSNEETQKIWDKYKHRIDKFVSEPDNGIYNACNKGIKLSNGQYLIFMNAGDCFYHKDILNLFNCFSGNNYSDIYYGQCECTYKKANNQGDYISNYPSKLSKEFFILSNICTQGMFINKNIFEKYGLFNEQYRVCADYEKWLQLPIQTFLYFPVIVANYDLNGISSIKKTRDLTFTEKNSIRNRYYTEKEILKAESIYKMQYSFWENIFSLKNTHNKTHKVVTIFGIHIKIKRSK